jgi:CheY-like chemotaxis protein
VLPTYPTWDPFLCPDRPRGGAVALRCSRPKTTENGTPAPAEQVAPGPRQQPADKPGVLVVDDEPLLLAVLKTGFRQRGFEVWVAAGGTEALELYRFHKKDIAVVLLDVHMPGLDGPRTLAALRRINPDVRCCFMTGNLGLYTEEELLALGAVLLFPKPFDLTGMTEALWRLAAERPTTDASFASGS